MTIYLVLLFAIAPKWQSTSADMTRPSQQTTNEPSVSPVPQQPSLPVPATNVDPVDYAKNAPVVVEAPVALPALQKLQPEEVFPARAYVSLPNGTNILTPLDSHGLGELKISNFTDEDAAVKLKTSADRRTVRFVYVRAMREVSLRHVSPGEYVVEFSSGRDWDSDSRRFRQDQMFSSFDRALSFSERQVDDRTMYSTQEITLHGVPNGNMRKLGISGDEFADDQGVGRRR